MASDADRIDFLCRLIFRPTGPDGNFCHRRVIVTGFIALAYVAPRLGVHTTHQTQLWKTRGTSMFADADRLVEFFIASGAIFFHGIIRGENGGT